jgi:hypothetical protein
MQFVSSRDHMYNGTFLVLFLVCVLVLLLLFLGPSTRGERTAVLVLGTPVFGMLFWIYFRTYYVVTEDRLIIHFGPFTQTLNRDRIFSIKPHRSIYSAPALSRDRFQVRYDKYGEVQVSPKDRAGFLEAMGYPKEDLHEI